MTMLSRRAAIAGALSLAGGAWAQDIRPLPRPAAPSGALDAPPALRPAAREEIAALVRAAGLDGRAGVALVDLPTGTVLASHDAGLALPPASVAKSVTALYALDALGPDHRFRTRVLAAGPVAGGMVEGDLILAGGGDPALATDRLADLARALRDAGVTGARGLRVWGGSLPAIRAIAPDQLPQLPYNPAVGGLNLNFNRVFMEWAREGAGWRVTLDARGDAFRPPVTVARVAVAARARPVYTYEADGDVDVWTVASGQLGDGGNRWLPVRNPDLYAGEAFRGLAAGMGVALPAPTRVPALPEGATEVAGLDSEPLKSILRDMLLYSTNPTAEIVGLSASVARGLSPATLRDSAAAMDRWIARETGARLRLVDHSGLGVDSRVSPGEMVTFLAARGVADRLRPLLKDIPLTDAAGEPLAFPPALVQAKTGTLNFVSTLAGYVRAGTGADLAFAVFAGDLDARAAAPDEDEIPAGSRDFLLRARRLQQVLLQRWGRIGA